MKKIRILLTLAIERDKTMDEEFDISSHESDLQTLEDYQDEDYEDVLYECWD